MDDYAGVKLGFTDTDSMMYLIPCSENIYSKLRAVDPEGKLWDFSNYPPGHPNKSDVNRLIPGRFKDEGASSPFTEGIYLRAKMYSIQNISKKLGKSTAKGIPKRVKEKELKHEAYRKALEEPEITRKLKFRKFENKDHRVRTIVQKKTGLSSYNDKIHLTKEGDNWIANSFGYNPC